MRLKQDEMCFLLFHRYRLASARIFALIDEVSSISVSTFGLKVL